VAGVNEDAHVDVIAAVSFIEQRKRSKQKKSKRKAKEKQKVVSS
jgi:hypothetical protein